MTTSRTATVTVHTSTVECPHCGQEYDRTITATVIYAPGRPARTHGEPADCYEAEGPELIDICDAEDEFGRPLDRSQITEDDEADLLRAAVEAGGDDAAAVHADDERDRLAEERDL